MNRHFIIILLLTTYLSGIKANAQSLLINEIQSSNISCIADFDGDYSDWVEIYNYGTDVIELGGMFLSDKPNNLNKWKFPNRAIMPGEHLIIWASGKDRVCENGEIHTNFSIKASGETIFLVQANGHTIIDKSYNQALPPDMSMGRLPENMISWYFFSDPTPGMANSTEAFEGFSPKACFSVQGGQYKEPVSVILSTEDGEGGIYYTTDGSIPDINSDCYSGPINIEQTSCIRARAIRPGQVAGNIITQTYLINENLNLDVVSLVTDPANFWGESGIYQHYNTGEERPIHIEYFDKEGFTAFQLDAGVKIHSPDNRTQKSLRLYARDECGTESIDYKIFENKNICHFKRLILRNGGNDGAQIRKTQIRDAYVHSIYQNLNPDYACSAHKAVHVFINGNYWGIYNLRERQDEYYIKDNYGYEADEIDFLEYDYAEPGIKKTICGDWQDFENMKAFVINNDMSVEQNYGIIKNWIDIDNFIDYQITEILIGNQDWCNNNIKFWRPRATGGRWKWVLWDTDYALGTYRTHAIGEPTFDFFTFAMQWGGWGDDDYTWLLRNLMNNENFKYHFITRSLDLLNSGLKPSFTIQHFDSLANGIGIDMYRQFEKWGSSVSIWENDLNYARTFIEQRPSNYLGHIAQYYGFDPYTCNITLDVNDANMGILKINTIELKKGSPGIGANTYPWEGAYYESLPIDVTAIAKPGYRFVKWEGDIISKDIRLNIQLESDIYLKAVFEKDPGTAIHENDNQLPGISFFPQPANDFVNIRFNNCPDDQIRLKITNLSGQCILEEHIQVSEGSNTMINISSLQPGVYIMTAFFRDSAFYSGRMLVQ